MACHGKKVKWLVMEKGQIACHGKRVQWFVMQKGPYGLSYEKGPPVCHT